MIVHFLQRIANIPKQNLFCAMISGQKAMERLSEIKIILKVQHRRLLLFTLCRLSTNLSLQARQAFTFSLIKSKQKSRRKSLRYPLRLKG
jgi:hypothetical protein